MTSPVKSLTVTLIAATLLSCGHGQTARIPPPPHEVSPDSVGHFCGMLLVEHPGPKGQIFVADQAEPVWFASVTETFAFTMLDEEPRNISAIYVTDMGRARNWEQPEPGTWIDARKALYVIDGRSRGGMGGNEAVPFAQRAQAEGFAAKYGGRIVNFNEMPRSYILQQSADLAGPAAEHPREAGKP